MLIGGEDCHLFDSPEDSHLIDQTYSRALPPAGEIDLRQLVQKY